MAPSSKRYMDNSISQEWTFERFTKVGEFEDHVKQQLPWYELATGAIAHIARHFLPKNGLIYDIGASTGNIGIALKETIKVRNARLIAIDKADSMQNLYRGPGSFVNTDAAQYNYQDFDVAVLFLLLMFLPIGERVKLVDKLIRLMKPGGVIIIVDKVTIPDPYLSTVLHRLTIAGKAAMGCDKGAIVDKELSLGGIQRPLSWNFSGEIHGGNINEFFRFGEFVGWVIQK